MTLTIILLIIIAYLVLTVYYWTKESIKTKKQLEIERINTVLNLRLFIFMYNEEMYNNLPSFDEMLESKKELTPIGYGVLFPKEESLNTL